MDRDTLLEAFFPDDIENAPEAYFEAIRRLRLKPPDKETVERIAEIARRIRKSWPGRRGWGWSPTEWDPKGLANRFRTYLARLRAGGVPLSHLLDRSRTTLSCGTNRRAHLVTVPGCHGD